VVRFAHLTAQPGCDRPAARSHLDTGALGPVTLCLVIPNLMTLCLMTLNLMTPMNQLACQLLSISSGAP
jgi:hypothetical protein